MRTYLELSIHRIRSYINSGVAKSRLAIDAGVPEGCTRDVEDEEWNPTTKTLLKLEAAIPQSFNPPQKPKTKKSH